MLGDKHGNVVIFGERDCSLQRRNQKVMEECPAAALSQKQRDDMIEICKSAAKKMGYTNAGTFEFMFEDGKFYFLEMNTRLQVEHPVTEILSNAFVQNTNITGSALSLGKGTSLYFSKIALL